MISTTNELLGGGTEPLGELHLPLYSPVRRRRSNPGDSGRVRPIGGTEWRETITSTRPSLHLGCRSDGRGWGATFNKLAHIVQKIAALWSKLGSLRGQLMVKNVPSISPRVFLAINASARSQKSLPPRAPIIRSPRGFGTTQGAITVACGKIDRAMPLCREPPTLYPLPPRHLSRTPALLLLQPGSSRSVSHVPHHYKAVPSLKPTNLSGKFRAISVFATLSAPSAGLPYLCGVNWCNGPTLRVNGWKDGRYPSPLWRTRCVPGIDTNCSLPLLNSALRLRYRAMRALGRRPSIARGQSNALAAPVTRHGRDAGALCPFFAHIRDTAAALSPVLASFSRAGPGHSLHDAACGGRATPPGYVHTSPQGADRSSVQPRRSDAHALPLPCTYRARLISQRELCYIFTFGGGA
ncbi:hypothetical protein DFH06DRAFT_1304277 [Mycena polygramma]|nr:hypothetical protein DFH06DRAFT_1304277 [Mycena polygramma]